MKKLITVAVIACATAVVNAATINWSVMNDWFSPDANADLAGTAYFFDASAYSISTISSGLETSGLSALSGSLGSKALEYGGLSDFAGTGFAYDGDAPASIKGFLMVISSDEQNYWSAGEVTVNVTDAIKGGQDAVFNFGYNESVSWSGAVASVPEPTSGLLLFLGMAGLALRRKRA